MDLLLMRVMVRGVRFIVGSLSARQASCVSVVARFGTLDWNVRLGLGASPEVIDFGGEKSPKRRSTNSKIWRKFLLFSIKELSNVAHFFLFGKRVEKGASIKRKSVWGCSALALWQERR
jgi:hypothetical protein